MREKVDTADAVVASIAARQHGVVAVGQLLQAGLDKSAISRRVTAGRLHRLYRGVYAVGHTGLSREARWIAAVLACGERAVLSYRSAGELWGMLPAGGRSVHVSVPSTAGRLRAGAIQLHRCPTLSTEQVTRRGGIPVTSPARTVVDLRRCVRRDELRRALRQAEVLGLDVGPTPGDRTRSELEAIFLELCRRHGLPAPRVNARVGPHVVDFLWPESRVVVETDGYRFHRGRVAFEEDRDRDLRLRALGYDVLRFSYRQVTREPERVVSAVRSAL